MPGTLVYYGETIPNVALADFNPGMASGRALV
jgi:hypothetical protein